MAFVWRGPLSDTKPYINIKWPGLLVVGERVTPDQAAEIIVRTGRWPMNCNDEEANKLFNGLIGPQKEWKKSFLRINPIILNYIHNERITTSYIGGPKGWANWDGKIFANSYNIGKWPSLSEVTDDWVRIAQEFPFLNLKCQVIDCEISEDKIWEGIISKERKPPNPIPTVEWTIYNGKVELHSPKEIICEVSQEEIDIFGGEIGATVDQVKLGIELSKKSLIKN